MKTATFVVAASRRVRVQVLSCMTVVGLILVTVTTTQAQHQRASANQNGLTDHEGSRNGAAWFLDGAPALASPSDGANQAPTHGNQPMGRTERKDKPSLEFTVKTYEKIAPNGSEVRLVCPHVVGLENTTDSFVEALQNRHHDADKQNQRPRSARLVHGRNLSLRLGRYKVMSAPNHDGHEQIRWFRNHVPLQSGAHNSPLRDSKGTSWQTKLGADTASSRQKLGLPSDNARAPNLSANVSLWPRATTHEIFSRLNWTDELMQKDGENEDNDQVSATTTTDDGNKDIYDGGDDSDDGRGQDKRATIHRRIDNVANANEFAQHGGPSEAAQSMAARKERISREQGHNLRHASRELDWFINEFGELVLPNINPSLSGSYTCLYGGQQSEVLLDVLPDRRASSESALVAQSGRSHLGRILNAKAPKSGAATLDEAATTINSGPVEQVSISFRTASAADDVGQSDSAASVLAHKWAHERPRIDAEGVRLVGAKSEQQEAGFRRTNLDIGGISKQSMDIRADAARYGLTRSSGGRHKRLSAATTTTTPTTTAATTVKAQPDKNLLAPEQPFTRPESPIGIQHGVDNENFETIQRDQGQIGVGQKSLNMSHLATALDPANRPPKWWAHINYLGGRPQNQRPHLVEAEIVSSRDLEFIPGLMFTRQQFHCPLMKQRDLRKALANQINLLIGNFCRPMTINDRLGAQEYQSCAGLVNRVVSQLLFGIDDGRFGDVGSNDRNGAILKVYNSTLDCLDKERAANIGKVAWYKDGTKLEFDLNGRGLDKELNVKLIDFIDRFESAPHGAHDKGLIDLEQNNGGMFVEKRISSSSVSLRERRTTKAEKQARHGGHILCPPNGLILEIDGIRRINAGRYTCALELNSSRLLTRLGTLKRLQPSRQQDSPEPENTSSGSGRLVGKNDISKCCDANEAEQSGAPALETKPEMDIVPDISSLGAVQLNSQIGSEVDSSNAAASFVHKLAGINVRDGAHIETPSTSSVRTDEFPARSMPKQLLTGNRAAVNNRVSSGDRVAHLFASKSIEILKSILNNASNLNEEAWNQFEQTVINSRPIARVQSFILSINERPANLCSLWSTIREANEAYSRRKLTDFRRLKLGLMKQASATISADDGGQQRQQLQRDERRRYRRRGRTLERRDSLNGGSNGGRRQIDGHHQQRRQHIAPSDDSDGDNHHDGAGGIDGKLVASLSWLNGVDENEEEGRLARVSARRRDDTEHARRRPATESTGQQNSLVLGESSLGIYGGIDGGARAGAGASNNGRQIGEVRQLERATKTGAVPHHSLNVWPNGSLVDANDADAGWTRASGAWRSARSANGASFRTTSRTNNGPAQSAEIVQNLAAREHKQEERDEHGPGNVAIPFNYANERNLDPDQEAARARGGGSIRRTGPSGEWAQTFVESLDLHLNTLDPAWRRRLRPPEASHKTKAETSAAGKAVVVNDGAAAAAMFDERHMDETQPRASQRGNTEQAAAAARSGASLARSGALSHAGGANGAEEEDQEEDEANDGDKTSTVQSAASGHTRRRPSSSLNRAVLIDDLARGRRVNSPAENVIDGNLEPPRAGAGHQDDSTSEPDEAPNEVSNRLETAPRVTGEAAASSGRPELAKQFDLRAGDQTNSTSTTESLPRQPAAMAGPNDGDRIWTPEFVTEKSNIRMRERARRRRLREFNNIVTVRGLTAWSGGVPQAADRSGHDGDEGADDGNFINSPFWRQNGQRQRLPRSSGRLILDDQSDRGQAHVVQRNGAADAPPSTRLNGGQASSIGHAGGGRLRAGQQSRQAPDWDLEGGHKLQVSRSEQARRFSRSDKSAWSGQQDGGGDVASYPLRRHRERRAIADGDQADDEIPSASAASPPATAHESAPVWAPPASGGAQYEANSASHDSDDSLQLPTSPTANPLDNTLLQAGTIATPPDNRELPSRAAASNGQTLSLTPNDLGSNTSLVAAASSEAFTDDDSIKQAAIVPGEDDEENLLWTVGQYLYMHVRAFAASSMYGVQVDVEWSNENERAMPRYRNVTLNADHEQGMGQNLSASRSNVSQSMDESEALGGAEPVSPVATIELVSGQDLHLHCTAQALGRLPEVKWYRKVQRLPVHIPARIRKLLARTVGGDLFWPVASLDLLDDDDEGVCETERASSQCQRADEFICSQSTTIFDNLLNQTFTVVNSLKLSGRQDDKTSNNLAPLDTRQMMMDSIKTRRPPVIYLCLVVADVRHEFVALGVKFRSAAASKLPSELSERLRARSVPEFAKATESTKIPSDMQLVAPDISDLRFRIEEKNINLLRQSQLAVPFEDIWIPIKKNSTRFIADDEYLREIYARTRYSINPLVLSLMICSLSSLLLALVYFTMRSYRALTSLQAEDDCEDLRNRQNLLDDEINESSAHASRPAESYCEFDMTKHAISHRLKRLDDDEEDDDEDDDEGMPSGGDGSGSRDTMTKQSSLMYQTEVPYNNLGTNVIRGIESQGSFYEAHFHHPDASLICDQMPASLISDMLSTDIKNELECSLTDEFGASKVCCSNEGQSQVMIMAQTTSWVDYDQGRINTVVEHSNRISPR